MSYKVLKCSCCNRKREKDFKRWFKVDGLELCPDCYDFRYGIERCTYDRLSFTGWGLS